MTRTIRLILALLLNSTSSSRQQIAEKFCYLTCWKYLKNNENKIIDEIKIFNKIQIIDRIENLEFKTLIKCVGGVKSCRSTTSHLSWSITDRLIPIFRPHTFNPRLQAVKTFWPDFTPSRIFSKMFLTTEIAQISSGGLIQPTVQSEKKTFWGQEKKAHSLFSGP